MKLKKLVFSAMFAALTCAATMVIHIPSPLGGYFNLGDCVVLLAAFLLEPAFAVAAGGIGSAMADLLLGAAIYAPGTLVIKSLMALAAGAIYRAVNKRDPARAPVGAVLGGLAAELLMAAGYFLYELPMYSLAACAENALVTNLPQGAVGLAAGFALYLLLDRAGLVKKMKGGFSHV